MRFTDRTVQALKPRAERYERWEDGRTGLGVRVSPAGRKTWIYMYRYQGRPRRMSLGVYPALSLADANLAHATAKKKLSKGTDPGAELVNKRQGERNAETVSDLIAEYLERYARPNKRSANQDERLFEKDVLPVWGRRKANSISRRDAITLLDGIVDRGSPIMANRTLSALKKVWNFGLDRDILDAMPFVRIRPPAKETPRDRVLGPAEIAQFWNGFPKTKITPIIQLALKLILVTAQRRGEVACAPWSEFDLEGEQIWTIRAERSKNGVANRVPLSSLALRMINTMPPTKTYVLNGARGARQHREAVQTIGLEDFRPHDLRRTAASFMASIGVPRVVIGKILNHVERDITAVYDRHGYDREKREALRQWALELARIVAGEAKRAEVVEFRR